MKRFFLASLYFFFASFCLWGQVQLNEDAERIMEMVLVDGHQLNAALVIYPYYDSWVFPLGEISESLGIKLNVSSALGGADGFILEESRIFRLSVKDCTFRVGDLVQPYNCVHSFVFRSDIFVTKDLLQAIFPIDVELELNRSRIVIRPKEKLPIQKAKEREQTAKTIGSLLSDYDPGYKRVDSNYRLVDGFFWDQQMAYTHTVGTKRGNWNSSTFLAGELLGFESRLLAASANGVFSPIRTTFSRHSALGEMLGPLQVRSIDLFDVSLPSLPLITDGATGRGGIVSNFLLNAPTRFGQQDLVGNLAPGWEVVLYQNEMLIGRQVNNGDGRYYFRSIPLLYGRNQFHLIFYGPYGETRDEYKTVLINNSLVEQGKAYFRAGVAQGYDAISRSIVQLDYGLTKFLTWTSGAFSRMNQNRTFGYGGFHLSLFDWYTSAICSANTDRGNACEVRLQGEPMQGVAFSGGYTNLSRFRSESLNTDTGPLLVERSRGTLGLPFFFSASRLELEAIRERFEDTKRRIDLRNRMSFVFGPLFILNELSWVDASPKELTGKLDLNFLPSSTLMRVGLAYTQRILTSIEGEIQVHPLENFVLQAVGRHSLESRATESVFSLSKIFDSFSAGLSGTFTNWNLQSIGTLFSFALGREPYENTLTLSSRPMTSAGAVSVRVFRDRNRDGIKQETESALEGVTVVMGQSSVDVASNQNGIAFFGNLDPHRAADITLSLASLKDPSLRPGVAGLRVYPRPGKTIPVDFPIVFYVEIEGQVKIATAKEPRSKKFVPIQVYADSGTLLKTVKTDREGAYLVEEMTPGTYILRVDPRFLAASDLKCEPIQQTVTLGEEEPFLPARDFFLSSSK